MELYMVKCNFSKATEQGTIYPDGRCTEFNIYFFILYVF